MSQQRRAENHKTSYYRITKYRRMLIDRHTPTDQIQKLLSDLGWIKDERVEELTIPGEGNMNVVLRVKTNQRSFILKQSRSFVNKYPTLDAPIDRIKTEYQFYQALDASLRKVTPEVLAYAEDRHLMMISDLGDCKDLSSLYDEREVSPSQIEKLVATLGQIHQSPVPKDYPDNLALRQLNYQHIFQLPFMESNGFDLDDIQHGLQDISRSCKSNDKLKSTVAGLGEIYLGKGDMLLHGDYYPGSWMQAGDDIYVIDPEFSFAGPAEFDLGVMAAHLIMITSEVKSLDRIKDLYECDFNSKLVNQFAGVEIMRRLIGLAQLPLTRSLEEKAELLKVAEQLVIS